MTTSSDLSSSFSGVSPASSGWIKWACPVCRESLQDKKPLYCRHCGLSFAEVNGIQKCLPPRRRHQLDRFMRDYEAVRRGEGRKLAPENYRVLPFQPGPGERAAEWRVRAAGFRTLRRALRTWTGPGEAPLKACDLGAGNGWLSNRLALAGLPVTAVDLSSNTFDGLGCRKYYDSSFVCAQAEFDHLPFQAEQFDLAVFNASLHYSTDVEVTVAEALRVLRPEGRIVVLDSPVYRRAESGIQMVREREQDFERRYGCRSNSLESENFLTFDRLEELATSLSLSWETLRPSYGLKWHLKLWKESLLGHREPARFMLLVGKIRAGRGSGREAD